MNYELRKNKTKEQSSDRVSPRRGFTLLFAVLVGGLLLALGIAISSIAVKEIVLSSSGRESQFAFYAADSGIECVLFWDIVKAPTFPNISADPLNSVTCNGTASGISLISGTLTAATSTFTMNLDSSALGLPSSACAVVVVGKSKTAADTIATVVESRGYNDCVDVNNPARVERALRVHY